jgi:hypothetical protein
MQGSSFLELAKPSGVHVRSGQELLAQFTDMCLTTEEVAQVWIDAISPISANDAVAMCVPAVVIAAGGSYDNPGLCRGKFHPTVQSGGYDSPVKGLWQINNGFDPDPKEQAKAVYDMYTSHNPDYGCLSSWCQESDCYEPISGIGQDESVMMNHRFCKGVWTAGDMHYAGRLASIGGITTVQNACAAASAQGGINQAMTTNMSPAEAAMAKAEIQAEGGQIVIFLKEKLGTVFREDTAERYANALLIAMNSEGISSLEKAAGTIGKSTSKAKVICEKASVDVEPMLLQEWFKSLDGATTLIDPSTYHSIFETWPKIEPELPFPWNSTGPKSNASSEVAVREEVALREESEQAGEPRREGREPILQSWPRIDPPAEPLSNTTSEVAVRDEVALREESEQAGEPRREGREPILQSWPRIDPPAEPLSNTSSEVALRDEQQGEPISESILQTWPNVTPGQITNSTTEVSLLRHTAPCISLQDVAKAWMSAISSLSASDAAAMCAPAVIIAAGASYDTPACPEKFDTLVVGGAASKGLWQISSGFDPDPKLQAVAVYNTYTSNDPGYGCLSDWCQATTCGDPIPSIGQDESITAKHRFCKGAWTATPEQFAGRINMIGGMEAVEKACRGAAMSR